MSNNNSLYIGGYEVEALYIGSQEVEKLYLGSEPAYEPSQDIVPDGCVRIDYLTTEPNQTITILASNGLTNYSSMEVDGVLLSAVTDTYTFTNAGKHSILFTVNGTTILRDTTEQRDCIVGFYVGEGITYFEGDLVSSCPEMKEVYFPSTITGTGRANLYYSPKVEKILGPTAVDNLYWGVGTDLWCVACAGVGSSVVIPTGFTAVKDYAFASYNSISSYTFHSGVTSVRGNAFENNSGAKELVFYGTTPPSFAYREIGWDGVMYVPYGCTSAYTSSVWGNLVTSYDWTIQEMNP